MAVHKYMFYIEEEGIRAYRAIGSNEYEIVRHMGEDIYKGNSLEEYFKWFDNVASIAADDSVDFCFLSRYEIEQFKIEYSAGVKSSWSKDEVIYFCKTVINKGNMEIHCSDDIQFVCQVSNIFSRDQIESFYLKCVPEFSIEAEYKKEENKVADTSFQYRYYKEILNGL